MYLLQAVIFRVVFPVAEPAIAFRPLGLRLFDVCERPVEVLYRWGLLSRLRRRRSFLRRHGARGRRGRIKEPAALGRRLDGRVARARGPLGAGAVEASAGGTAGLVVLLRLAGQLLPCSLDLGAGVLGLGDGAGRLIE